MKAKITKKDGTVIELEGTAAELTTIIDPPKPQITLAPPAKPACPGIGDKVDLGKMLDELTKGAKTEPYQPQYPIQPIDPGFWQWPRIVYNDGCPMGGYHDYPQVWMSVSPPACSKCGKGTGISPYSTVLCTQTTPGEQVENGTKYEFASTLPAIVSGFVVVEPQS
jgi:hypothetical protein